MVADPFNVITKLYSWAGLGTIIPQPVKKHILELVSITVYTHTLSHRSRGNAYLRHCVRYRIESDDELNRLSQWMTGLTPEEKVAVTIACKENEAADVDLESVREAALSGIATLCKQDDRFAAYEDTLLSKDAMVTPREMHTQDVNQKIDKSITSLLRLLSPYLMNRPSHLVLEYLVRHYKVYHYNVDAVVECILPWHDSNVFVRMVQLLNLSQSNGRWEFLTAVAKTGTPLPRHALAQRAAHDMALLDFVCSLAKRNGSNTKGTQFTHVFSFFSAVVVEAMQGLTTLHEGLVRVVLPVLLIGVRATKSPHYQAACYFVTAHLSSRTALSIEACNALLIALAK
eukprot:7127-Heterococcus_DN1.PRE.2